MSDVTPQQEYPQRISPRQDRQDGGSSFWTSLPGLLTAISGLLTALVAVGAFVYQIAGSEDDSSASANQPANQSAIQSHAAQSHAATSPQPAPSPSVPAGGDTPLWHNSLVFTNYGIDFDVTPPDIKPGGGFDIYDADGNQISPGGGGALLAKWTGSGTPTAADCADLVNRLGTANTGSLPKFYEGAKFCLRTNDAHKIVFIVFLNQRSGNYLIDATVWAPVD